MPSPLPPFTPPANYPRVKVVDSFEALVSTPLRDGVNALCWPRQLAGDFGEVVAQLGAGKGITTIDDERLLALDLSDAGKQARNVILEDLALLRSRELSPVLDCINGYLHEEESSGPMATHVQSFHADSATVEADTYLCTYHGLSSEGLRNDEAQRRVDIAETRTELLRHYGGTDDAGFLDYLNEHYFDLHYAPLPQAQPWSFGQGNLWRIACEYPGSPVPPCIHRAPDTLPGQSPRLLLIS
jgi:hypothetical protein